LTGYTAIVTGGNTGIGYETCLALAKKNATVYMASRSSEKAETAIDLIFKDTGKKVNFLSLDLQDLNQVKAAADNFLKLGVPLDILINNAGIMFCPFELTKDGIESQFATNHVGHFVLV
jgi:NAD(P)-dependent dehydrogenase (short-subunit alcohol dehydrogenase family)